MYDSYCERCKDLSNKSMDQLLGDKSLFTRSPIRNMRPRVQGWAGMRAWRIPIFETMPCQKS